MPSDLVRRLEAELEDLMKRMPRHSTPPALLERLEELEAALAEARASTDGSVGSDADDNTRR